MKKLTVFLLTLSLLICLLGGCASAPEEPAVSETPASQEPLEEAPTAPVEEAPPAEEAPEAAEAPIEPAKTISYPISDGSLTFSVFYPLNTGYAKIITTWYDAPTLPIVEKATGVKLEFQEPSEQTRTEQFNLMIASGDVTDFFNSEFYTGGVVQAWADETICDLTDLLEENAPDYYALISSMDHDSYANLPDEEGRMLFMSPYNLSVTDMGNVIRQDWLDALGLETPSTTGELKDVLAAFKAEYNCDRTFHLENNGIMTWVVGAFGCSGFDLEGKTGVGLYREGETVVSSLLSDGYKEYLEYLADLYAGGLVNNEFYAFQRSAQVMNSITMLGGSGIWESDPTNIVNSTANARKENPDYESVPMARIVKNEGDTYHFNSISTTTSTNGTCVWSGCESPEMAVQFMNWFFTEEGKMLSVYGTEGQDYVVGDDGSITFTDFIMDNPDGNSFFNMLDVYSGTWGMPGYMDSSVFYYSYDEDVSKGIMLWREADSSGVLPSFTLTTDESNEYTNISSDICTRAAEQILKWITGEEKLTDEGWENMKAQLEAMDIGRCVEIYQQAYDRYLAK